MFDEETNQQSGKTPQAGQKNPEGVEDMFADIEQPQPQAPTSGQEKSDAQAGGSIPTVGGGGIPWKPILIILAVLAVVIGAGAVSFYLLSSRGPSAPQPPEEEAPAVMEEEEAPAMMEEEPTEEPTMEEEEPSVMEEETPTEAPTADRDKDGLSDIREAELGTSPTSPDTDEDGLFDREEVEVYETDPLNPDTDGDGYEDGSEVENGYNPNGPGELRTPPQEG